MQLAQAIAKPLQGGAFLERPGRVKGAHHLKNNALSPRGSVRRAAAQAVMLAAALYPLSRAYGIEQARTPLLLPSSFCSVAVALLSAIETIAFPSRRNVPRCAGRRRSCTARPRPCWPPSSPTSCPAFRSTATAAAPRPVRAQPAHERGGGRVGAGGDAVNLVLFSKGHVSASLLLAPAACACCLRTACPPPSVLLPALVTAQAMLAAAQRSGLEARRRRRGAAGLGAQRTGPARDSAPRRGPDGSLP